MGARQDDAPPTATGELSPQALAFLAAYECDDTPTDFANIASIRAQTANQFAPGAERAISRHALVRQDVEIGGIECERISSERTSEASGTLVYIFGGGFIVGCPHSDLPIIGALAEQCSVDVIAPKYRLAPEYPAPAALEDCAAVYERVADATQGRLLLAGESAGGNLAVLVAQTAVARQLRVPDVMALLSPAADLRPDQSLFEPTWLRDPTLHPVRVADVGTAYVADSSATDPKISPLFGPMQGLPPTIITTGTRDLLMCMCLRLDRAMRRAGVEVDTRVWDGLWHVFEYYDEYPEAAESLMEIARFINARSA